MASEVADQELRQADPHVVPEPRQLDLADSRRGDRGGLAEEEGVDDAGPCAKLPEEQEADDADQAEGQALVAAEPPGGGRPVLAGVGVAHGAQDTGRRRHDRPARRCGWQVAGALARHPPSGKGARLGRHGDGSPHGTGGAAAACLIGSSIRRDCGQCQCLRIYCPGPASGCPRAAALSSRRARRRHGDRRHATAAWPSHDRSACRDIGGRGMQRDGDHAARDPGRHPDPGGDHRGGLGTRHFAHPDRLRRPGEDEHQDRPQHVRRGQRVRAVLRATSSACTRSTASPTSTSAACRVTARSSRRSSPARSTSASTASARRSVRRTPTRRSRPSRWSG